MWPIKEKENRHSRSYEAKILLFPVKTGRYGSLISINLSGIVLVVVVAAAEEVSCFETSQSLLGGGEIWILYTTFGQRESLDLLGGGCYFFS